MTLIITDTYHKVEPIVGIEPTPFVYETIGLPLTPNRHGASGGSRTLSTTLPKWRAAVITTLAKLEQHVGNAPTTHGWKPRMYL